MFVARGKYLSIACFCVLAVASITGSALEQTTPPMPEDPNQLLLLAQKQNRLANPDIPHWHLKISVTQFDPSGGVTVKSQVEEFWAGESKHKIIYTTPNASMTEYATEKGRFRSAGNQISPGPLMATGNAFTNPIFENESLIEKWILHRENRKVNGVKLICVSTRGIKAGSEKHEFTGSTYCLDPEKPSLLSRMNGVGTTSEVVYTRSSVQDFHGYYVPKELELTVGGKRTVEAHLELIEDLAQEEDAFFLPPSDAVSTPVVKTVSISAGISHAILEHANAPDYPIAAKAAGISGTVVLTGKINKDGSVSDLKVVSGPKELQQAAMDSVRTWTYKPYLLNGEPVEVRTTINVVFQPGR